MKYLFVFFLLFVTMTGCNHSSKEVSAIKLNDSAVKITNHFQDTAKFKQAIALLNKAIKQDSSIFELVKNKYFFEASLGDYKSALETNRHLLIFRPDSADLHFQAATFELLFGDTIQSTNSYAKAALLYKATLDTMNKNSPYYFYDWRLWMCCMIMSGRENIVHNFLKENCINAIDSSIYQPEMLSKSKSELQKVITERLIENKYSR